MTKIRFSPKTNHTIYLKSQVLLVEILLSMDVKELYYSTTQDLDKLILLFFYKGTKERMLWNRIEENFKLYPKLKFFSVDTSLHPELAKSFVVKTPPTLLVISNGKEMERYQGEELTEDKITRVLENQTI